MSPRAIDSEHYLLSVKLRREQLPSARTYPFSLPLFRSLNEIFFHPKVTFFVGENGSGKSTLLEAIATGWGFNPEGGSKNFRFHTRESHSSLHQHLRLVKTARRPKDGYFFRAESFYNVATEIEALDREPGSSRLIDSYGGRSLHEQSHGESFLSLFNKRFRGNGLYILDEPEAALSPTRQMEMIKRLHELVKMNSQLIIATHSPILMAYPDADIWQVSDNDLVKTSLQETEHYIVANSFLSNPEHAIRQLLF